MTGPHREGNGHLTTGLPAAILPALIAFVGTGLLSPLYSGEHRTVALTLWQAVVLWPIGGLLLGVPAWLLAYGVRERLLFRGGQAILVIFAVWSMAATARSDDAQAGLNFFIVPWFGTIAIAGLLAFQGIWHRSRRH